MNLNVFCNCYHEVHLLNQRTSIKSLIIIGTALTFTLRILTSDKKNFWIMQVKSFFITNKLQPRPWQHPANPAETHPTRPKHGRRTRLNTASCRDRSTATCNSWRTANSPSPPHTQQIAKPSPKRGRVIKPRNCNTRYSQCRTAGFWPKGKMIIFARVTIS